MFSGGRMTREERLILINAILRHNKLEYGALYMEEAAALVLGVSEDTVKRARRFRGLKFVRVGEKGVRYFGYQIANMLIDGIVGEEDEEWDGVERRKTSRSETGGSTAKAGAPTGTAVSSQADRLSKSALELARKALEPTKPGSKR
jgi:hypothetical protein